MANKDPRKVFIGSLAVLSGVAVTLFSYPCLDVFRLFDRLHSLTNEEHKSETPAMCNFVSPHLITVVPFKD